MQKKVHIGEIVERSKKLEAALKEMGAEGRGMHELANSVKDKLEPELLKKLWFIATIRNKAIHEPDFDIPGSIDKFLACCDEAENLLGLEKSLSEPPAKKTRAKPKPEKPKTPPRKRRKQVKTKPSFNYLNLMPFIPGLNIIYLVFIWVQSTYNSSVFLTMLLVYLISAALIAEGLFCHHRTHWKIGGILFIFLYLCTVFVPFRGKKVLKFLPLLNMVSIFAQIKKHIHWKLFFIASLLIIFTVISVYSYVIWKDRHSAIVLYACAYFGGIVFFLYAGKRNRSIIKK